MKIQKIYEDNKKSKYPFATKILEERLSKETSWLENWNTKKKFIEKDQLSINELESINANINSCQHRIIELKDAIAYLKIGL